MEDSKILVAPGDLERIEGSIQKWGLAVKYYQAMGKEGKPPGGGYDCPLCRKYNPYIIGTADECEDPETLNCGECPIRKATGQSWCEGTPHDNRKLRAQSRLAWAEAELAFLRDLLTRCEEE